MRLGLGNARRAAALAATAALLLLAQGAGAIGVARPEDVNLDPEPLDKIVRDLQDQVAFGELAGAAFQVYRCVDACMRG